MKRTKRLKNLENIQTIYANFCSDSLGLPKTSFLFDKEQGGALNDIGSYVLGFILGIHEEEIDKIEIERKMDASQQQKAPLTVRWKDMQKSSEPKERS